MTTYTPIIEQDLPTNSVQTIYRFPNGYGASVIRGPIAYGGLELAVTRYADEGVWNFDLDYDTPVAGDVLGGLREDDVPRLLAQIAALPKVAVSA